MSKGSNHFVIYGAIAANALIAIGKFAAASITGSSAMISEGIHSAIDTGNGLLLLWGVRQSKRPPDENHPFGHGKELYFWSLLVAIIIFGIGGALSVFEGLHHLIHPVPLENPAWNYWVLGFAGTFELISWIIALSEFKRSRYAHQGIWRTLRKSKDPTVFTVLFEDSAAILGVIVAFVGVLAGHLWNNPYCDGGASIAIGFILALVAVLLAKESKGLLVGESADQADVESIKRLAEADPAVERVTQPLTMHLAPHNILLNLSVRFRRGLSVGELEQAIGRLEDTIRHHHPHVRRIFIEAHALRPGALDVPLDDDS